jgi:enterochelin esterase family protein
MLRKLLTIILFSCLCSTARATDDYKLGPDSERHDGVPQGKVEKFQWTSEVFKGTVRDCWVYIPSQYDGKHPACVMVFQDGSGYVSEKGSWRVPIVFDNLINKKQMPVTIGIFLNPGVFPDQMVKDKDGKEKPKSNRSFEYDTLSDQYSKFLLDEIFPEVTKRFSVQLTSDPEGRAISGLSSGGICSFTVAWQRPDAFRKVVSFIGSYTNIRGGNAYPDMIKNSEKKPIRVFLQDGSNDLQNQFGKWFEANQAMAAALKEKGYDYQFVAGDGGHTPKHGGSILPDALRWVWRDYSAKE